MYCDFRIIVNFTFKSIINLKKMITKSKKSHQKPVSEWTEYFPGWTRCSPSACGSVLAWHFSHSWLLLESVSILHQPCIETNSDMTRPHDLAIHDAKVTLTRDPHGPNAKQDLGNKSILNKPHPNSSFLHLWLGSRYDAALSLEQQATIHVPSRRIRDASKRHQPGGSSKIALITRF